METGPGADHLHDGPPGDARQNDPGVKGRGDQLLGAVTVPQQDEQVHGPDFGNLVIWSKQPQTLLTAVLLRNLNGIRIANVELSLN